MAILSETKKLKKSLSLFNVYTLATGATLSSGFFLLPGLAAAEAGPAMILSYLLALLPLMPGMLAKIELATAMPRAGGVYYFLDRSLGPMAGTISGMGTWCSLVLKTAFALIGVGAYLVIFFPNAPMVPLAAGLAAVFGIVNLLGTGKSSLLQAGLVITLLLLLTWFVADGAAYVQADYYSGFFDQGFDNIFAASGMVCISYMGVTKVASVAEEAKDPERTLTLGILFALGTAVVIYGLGTWIIVGVVDPQVLYKGDCPSLTPVADAAHAIAGRPGAVVMTIAAVMAFLSVGNAGILSASRYPLAMGRDHLLPTSFRKLNRYGSPQNGVILTTAAVLVSVTLLDPTKIAKLASSFMLLLFALNSLAVIVMRESKIESYDPGFRSPWYPWLHLAGIAGPAAYIVMMGALPMLFSGGLILVGAVWYIYYAKARVTRGGAIYHLFARLGQRRYAGLDRELRGILKEKGLRTDDPYDQIVARADVINEPDETTFEQIVTKAAGKLAVHLPISAEQLSTSIMEGTRVGATPVSKGVALPHVRLPGLENALMVLARTPRGVSVQIDHNLTDHGKDQSIFAAIFLVSPEEDASLHLRILAQVAQHVDDEDFMSKWMATDDERELKEALLHEERFIQLVLEPDTPSASLIDQPLCDLSLPEGSLVAMVERGGEMIIPRGNTILREGDRLTTVGLPGSITELRMKYHPM